MHTLCDPGTGLRGKIIDTSNLGTGTPELTISVYSSEVMIWLRPRLLGV